MKLQVCTGKSCAGKFSKYIKTRIENDIKFYKWEKVEVSECACMGECKTSPNMKIGNQKHNYMNPSKASQLLVKELK